MNVTEKTERILKRNSIIDRIFLWVSLIISMGVLGVCLALFEVLVQGSFLSFKTFGFSFLFHSDWNPVTQSFGGLAAIYGTLVTSLLALLLGIPIAFGTSYFITELAPLWLKTPLTILIELLALVPSIILGMWGLFVFAPSLGVDIESWLNNALSTKFLIGNLFGSSHVGINILTASFILALMIIPFITSIFKDAFDLVPKMIKESAYGLGATTWEVVWHIVLPYTKRQVIGGIMLGLGSALGETMAVAFVIGNAHSFTISLLMTGCTISSVLANEFTEAVGDLYSSSLFYLALILSIISSIILGISRWLLRGFNKRTYK